MLEIEMKFPVNDFGPIRQQLTSWNARADAPIDEADHYFNAPDRDFAKTDEALRLRRIGPANIITYKGPKQPGLAKTRTEIEAPLAPGPDAADQFCRLITHLKYRPTAVVRKQRTIHHFDKSGFALQVCLDEVETLGKFAEVEIMAPAEQRGQAEAVLQEVAAALGLTAQERRSYLEMVLLKVENEVQARSNV